MSQPGWHILGSGLPFLVSHKTEDLHTEQNLWSSDDWAWAAVFVRLEVFLAGFPSATMKTEELDNSSGKLGGNAPWTDVRFIQPRSSALLPGLGHLRRPGGGQLGHERRLLCKFHSHHLPLSPSMLRSLESIRKARSPMCARTPFAGPANRCKCLV